MALEHQTLPPGAYIFFVEKWEQEKESASGKRMMKYRVRLPGTSLTLPYYIHKEGTPGASWRELCRQIDSDWMEMMTAPVGRYFVINVGRMNLSPTQRNTYQNTLSFPLLEVFELGTPLEEKFRRPEWMRRRWSLWMGEDGELRADPIAPAWGGGGYVVIPEASGVTPPWEEEE